MSQKLLVQLRAYYGSLKRRNGWMFPSRQLRRPDDPITEKTVWHACRTAARCAGISKPIHPHTIRHCFATHLLDNGAELPVLQRLLGHDDPRDTMIYLHLSTRTQLSQLMLQNKRVLYELLFRSVSATLLEVAANPKRLGAGIGFLCVLHTWGQTLTHHPHIHCVVPAGGFAPTARPGCGPSPPVSFSQKRCSPRCSEASSTTA